MSTIDCLKTRRIFNTLLPLFNTYMYIYILIHINNLLYFYYWPYHRQVLTVANKKNIIAFLILFAFVEVFGKGEMQSLLHSEATIRNCKLLENLGVNLNIDRSEKTNAEKIEGMDFFKNGILKHILHQIFGLTRK